MGPTQTMSRQAARFALMAVVLASSVAAATPWLRGARGGKGTAVPAELSTFCLPFPPEAVVSPAEAIDRRIVGTVPDMPRAFGDAAPVEYTLTQGQVVQVTVDSPRLNGNLAIHGLTGMSPIRGGGRTQFEFRSLYSGRFPVHFHGEDGSHFEIIALDIQPSTKPIAVATRFP